LKAQPRFLKQQPFVNAGRHRALTKAFGRSVRGGQPVRGIASLDDAGPMHLTFFDNLKIRRTDSDRTKAEVVYGQRAVRGQGPRHVAVFGNARHSRLREFVMEKSSASCHSDTQNTKPFARKSWFGTTGKIEEYEIIRSKRANLEEREQ